MPQTQALMSQMYLKIGGAGASAEMMNSLIYMEVDDSLLLPDMFCILLRDPSFKWADSSDFELGKKVEITAKDSAGSDSKLIAGDITAVEPRFSQAVGPTLLVTGYVESHRLHRSKQTRTFVQQTDSDIAQKVAKACGLKIKVDSTREVNEYVCQDNQTDMEFLQDRAQRIGYQMYVQDGTLHFVKTPSVAPQVPVLEWGKNLRDFQARLSTAGQVGEVVVRGWDPKAKKEIVGTATTPQDTPKIGEKSSGGQAAKKAFNMDSKEIVVDRPVATQGEATAMAQSICDEKGNSFVQAEGTCNGDPGVHAGAIVELKGIGTRFSGRYRITHALHRYDENGYTTQFTISGRKSTTIGDLLNPGNSGGRSIVIGIVTNNRDPQNMGRVKVKFPTLPGNEESTWARIVSPMAGDGRGFQFIPEVNDEVVVAFEHDDVNRPFVLGALWNGKDKMPESGAVNSTGKVDKRVIKSRSGHTITLDDTDGGEKVSIVDKTNNNAIRIDSKTNSITVEAKDKTEIHTLSGHKVVLNDTAGSIQIVDKSGSNSIVIDSMQNSITIKSALQLSIESTQLKIKATQLDIEGTMTTIKGDAMMTVQGGLVKIN